MKSKQVQEFKETEIGKIPVDWEVDEIGNILSLLRDGSHNPPKRVTNGIKFIAGASDIENNQINFNNCTYITKEDYEKIHPKWEVKENDVLLTIVGTIGKTAIVKKSDLPFSLQRSLAVLRTNEKVNYRFLFYWCNSLKFKQLIYAYVNPTGQPGIYLGSISQFLIPIPSIEEQLRIIDILFHLDAKIKNLQNQNKILEQTAQAIFKSWFADFDGVTEWDDSELGKIPKGWSVDKLVNVCSKITDGSHFSPKEETNGVKMIGTVKNMNEHDFDFDSCKKISDEDYHKLVKNGCKAELGDVLLSKDGTMGLSMLYQNTIDLVLLSSIAIIKTNENFSNYYLKILLSQKNNLSVLIGGHSSGSALPRIVLKDLGIFQLLVPNNLILKKFDNIIRPMYTEIFSNSQKIQNITKTRDALLPKLMSGEIRV